MFDSRPIPQSMSVTLGYFEYITTVHTIYDLRHLESFRTSYGVYKRIVHYNYNTFDEIDARYDITLLKLDSHLPIQTNKSCRYIAQTNGICLPDTDIVNTDEELALTAGFGYIDYGIANYGPLIMGWIIIDKPFNNSLDLWSDRIIAHRYPINSGAATCAGDSGGPLVQYVGSRAVLIGLVRGLTAFENMIETDCIDYNTINKMDFIRISRFVNWIIDTIKYN
ncbi:chymotrypsin-like protease CTRL-1 [Oppia nitens]|uniref:chymotrypsin-like protease CTRL-1 n=1 Tax=Oppia nitens TaxID=1686743 RepID=UPI0023D9F455|nr:chymotrypsin-like protease CTRL-1 [Oppia nitens]